MKQEIDSTIKQILDEYYRKSPRFDYVELVQEILKRKPSTLPSQIASVISSIIGKRNSLYPIPDFLMDIFVRERFLSQFVANFSMRRMLAI